MNESELRISGMKLIIIISIEFASSLAQAMMIKILFYIKKMYIILISYYNTFEQEYLIGCICENN